MSMKETPNFVDESIYNTTIDLSADGSPYRIVFHGRCSYSFARRWIADPSGGTLRELMRDGVVTIEKRLMAWATLRKYEDVTEEFVSSPSVTVNFVNDFAVEDMWIARQHLASEHFVWQIYGLPIKWAVDEEWYASRQVDMDIREFIVECTNAAILRYSQTGQMAHDERDLLECGIAKRWPEVWNAIEKSGMRSDGDYEFYIFEILEALGVDTSSWM